MGFNEQTFRQGDLPKVRPLIFDASCDSAWRGAWNFLPRDSGFPWISCLHYSPWWTALAEQEWAECHKAEHRKVRAFTQHHGLMRLWLWQLFVLACFAALFSEIIHLIRFDMIRDISGENGAWFRHEFLPTIATKSNRTNTLEIVWTVFVPCFSYFCRERHRLKIMVNGVSFSCLKHSNP